MKPIDFSIIDEQFKPFLKERYIEFSQGGSNYKRRGTISDITMCTLEELLESEKAEGHAFLGIFRSNRREKEFADALLSNIKLKDLIKEYYSKPKTITLQILKAITGAWSFKDFLSAELKRKCLTVTFKEGDSVIFRYPRYYTISDHELMMKCDCCGNSQDYIKIREFKNDQNSKEDMKYSDSESLIRLGEYYVILSHAGYHIYSGTRKVIKSAFNSGGRCTIEFDQEDEIEHSLEFEETQPGIFMPSLEKEVKYLILVDQSVHSGEVPKHLLKNYGNRVIMVESIKNELGRINTFDNFKIREIDKGIYLDRMIHKRSGVDYLMLIDLSLHPEPQR